MPERRKPSLRNLDNVLSSPLKYLSSCPVWRPLRRWAGHEPLGKGPIAGCARWGPPCGAAYCHSSLEVWDPQLCLFHKKVKDKQSLFCLSFTFPHFCSLLRHELHSNEIRMKDGARVPALNLTLTPCPNLPRDTDLLSLPQLPTKYLASAHLRWVGTSCRFWGGKTTPWSLPHHGFLFWAAAPDTALASMDSSATLKPGEIRALVWLWNVPHSSCDVLLGGKNRFWLCSLALWVVEHYVASEWTSCVRVYSTEQLSQTGRRPQQILGMWLMSSWQGEWGGGGLLHGVSGDLLVLLSKTSSLLAFSVLFLQGLVLFSAWWVIDWLEGLPLNPVFLVVITKQLDSTSLSGFWLSGIRTPLTS